MATALLQRYRVVDPNLAVGLQQSFDESQGGSLTHIVGLGLECHTPDSYCATGKRRVVVARELLEEHLLLLLVHLLDSLQHLHRVTLLLGGANQRTHILGEARASVATTRVEELLAYAGVGAYALADHIHIGAHPLAQVGHIVHKRYACGEHSVGGILGHLCRWDIHKQHAEVIYQERAVELGELLLGSHTLHAHNHTVGRHKILDGGTLLQELGVRRHFELYIFASSLQLLLHGTKHLRGCTYGSGGFNNEQSIFFYRASKLVRYGKHLTQVGRAIFVGRRAYGYEDHLHAIDTLRE